LQKQKTLFPGTDASKSEIIPSNNFIRSSPSRNQRKIVVADTPATTAASSTGLLQSMALRALIFLPSNPGQALVPLLFVLRVE